MPRRFDIVRVAIIPDMFGGAIEHKRPRFIGLAGRKFSGKDSCATALAEFLYVRDAFADDVKLIAHEMFPQVELAAFSDGRKEQPVPGMGNTTPRDLAKAVGTGMRAVDPDFWVKRVLARVPTKGQTVITDTRFLNEVDSIHAAGGFVIRLNRADRGPAHEFYPHYDKTGPNAELCNHRYLEIKPGGDAPYCRLPRTSHPCSWTADRHPSETELPDSGAIYDAVIEAGSAESAAEQVLKLIQEFRA